MPPDPAPETADEVRRTHADASPPPVAYNPVPTDAATAHNQCITADTGPEVCVACHEAEARDMHGSVHYQRNGPSDYVTNIDGLAGERGFDFAATGINTYCGTHEDSPRFTCAGCHVGNGRFPMAQSEFDLLPAGSEEAKTQLANIDCLMCHQEAYKGFPDWIGKGGFEDLVLQNVATDANGHLVPSDYSKVTRTGYAGIPKVDSLTQDFQFLPAGLDNLPTGVPMAPMAVTTLQAAQTVHATTRPVSPASTATPGRPGPTGRNAATSPRSLPTPPTRRWTITLRLRTRRANGHPQ